MTDTSTTAPVNRRGLTPFDPAKHARFKAATEYGFAFAPPSYPIDRTGGTTNLGMGGNGPDPTLEGNSGQPCGDCGPNIVPKNVDTVTAAILGLPHVPMTSNQVVALYFTYQAILAGASWRPPLSGPWTAPAGLDNGVDLGDWLLWLYQQSMIDGFVKIDLADLDAALATFRGPVVVGVNLNDQADNQFPTLWDVGPGDEPDPNDGHAIGYGYAESPSGPFKWASWAQWVPSTLAWKQACPQQAFAVLTKEDAEATGFPLAALTADLDALGGTAAPVQATPPAAPTPAPSPSSPPPFPDPPSPLPATHEPWVEDVKAWAADFARWCTDKLGEAFASSAGSSSGAGKEISATLEGPEASE